MHGRVGPMLLQHGIEPLAISRITLLERPPADLLAMAIDQVVVGDRLMAGTGQCLAGMGTDVASATGDQHLHRKVPPRPMP